MIVHAIRKKWNTSSSWSWFTNHHVYPCMWMIFPVYLNLWVFALVRYHEIPIKLVQKFVLITALHPNPNRNFAQVNRVTCSALFRPGQRIVEPERKFPKMWVPPSHPNLDYLTILVLNPVVFGILLLNPPDQCGPWNQLHSAKKYQVRGTVLEP